MDQKFPLPAGDAYQPQAPPPPYTPYSPTSVGSGAIGFEAMPTAVPAMQQGPPMKQGPPMQYVPPIQNGPPMQYVHPMQHGPPMQQSTAPAVTVVHVPVVTQTVIGPPCLGAYSVRMVCPRCHVDMTTTLEKSPSSSSWLASFLCCFFGFAFGCCLIPLCMDSCQQVEHRCTNCKSYLGKYSQY